MILLSFHSFNLITRERDSPVHSSSSVSDNIVELPSELATAFDPTSGESDQESDVQPNFEDEFQSPTAKIPRLDDSSESQSDDSPDVEEDSTEDESRSASANSTTDTEEESESDSLSDAASESDDATASLLGGSRGRGATLRGRGRGGTSRRKSKRGTPTLPTNAVSIIVKDNAHTLAY